MRLLVIEDEMDLRNALKKGLEKSGFAVDAAEEGSEGLAFTEINEYDLVILDLNLPGIDGIEVLKKIRDRDRKIKVLILSARGEVEDKVLGLDIGANDYLVKPFHFKELVARVRALLRREFVDQGSLLTIGKLKLDTIGRCVYENEDFLELTKTELQILEFLLINKGNTVSTEKIMEHVYDNEADIFSNSISVHIHALRKKIRSCVIKTVRGIGYRLEEQ
ncbi:MAG: response regulator transcription factor [Clostridiales bacterium]|nr:response regulator transcription factor [Clostridiales bacterium]